MASIGMVYLVGAGPGDPELVTLRAVELLSRADLVLYDYLVNAEILAHAPPSAELVCLGRHGRTSLWSPAEIHQAMVDSARQGKTVVRLKSGDPLIFSRAAGELECLRGAGIPFEIVPGVTSGLAAASYAGVPLTSRDLASAVALVTGQEDPDKEDAQLDYEALARFPGTLVIYMGVTTAARWTARLLAAGMPPDRPVALVRRCSWPDQRLLSCRLDEVAPLVTPYARFPPPVIAIIGEVARRAPHWNWFEERPLFGVRVLVTRPRHQSDQVQRQLRELGADVLLQPAIEISAPTSWQQVDDAQDRLAEYDHLVFSSANGVHFFCQRWLDRGRDFRRWSSLKLAAIGPGTAEALNRFYLHADRTPDTLFRAESLVELFEPEAHGKRFLLVRASRGREVLAEGLRAAGAIVDQVVAYESRDVVDMDESVAERVNARQLDWVMATSTAIANAAVRLLGDAAAQVSWASISPLTSAALRAHGLEPAAEASEATLPALIQSIVDKQTTIRYR